MAPTQPRNKTSSAHRTAFLRGEHRFDIVDFRARKEVGVRNTVRSADFQAGGCTWALICRFDVPQHYSRPRGVLRTQLQLDSVILQLVSNDARSGGDVVAKASLRIDDPAPPPPSGKKNVGPRRWPPAVWRSTDPTTFPTAARGYNDDDPHECTGTSYWELSVPDAFRESLYVRDDRLSIHCTVDVLQEEADNASATKNCFISVVPPPSIPRDLRKLLDESESKKPKPDTHFVTDVIFVVEETEIKAHRLVLAMRSPVFAAELLGEMKEGAACAPVMVDDMTASTFRAMLYFIYTDELPPLKPKNNGSAAAGDLLVAADRYDLERLRLMCEKILAENMDAASVMTTLMLVHGRDSCRQLEAACIEYMASNPDVRDAVVATEEYKELKAKCGAFVTDVLEKVWTRAVVPRAPTSPPSSPTPATRQPQKSASMFNSSEVFSGTHEFRIANFASVQRRFGVSEYVTSAPFEIGGYDWIIRVFPSGEVEGDEEEQYISIFLTMTTYPTVDVWVSYCFRIDDPTGASSPVRHQSEGFYSANDYSWGVKFMGVATAKSYYVRHDGSLTVHCDVSVTKEYSCTITGADAAGAMGTAITVPSSNIAAHLERLMVSEQGSDVTFLVGDIKLRAHRLVIAARAPVLHKAMAVMVEPDTVDHRVRMDDIEAQVFRSVLDFIYTEELPEHLGNTTAMARDMLAAADRFGLERMKAMCENILCEHVTTENVVGTLKLADRHHCQGLKDFCMEHISQTHVLEKAVETKGFKDLKTTCPSLLEEIIIKISKLSSSDR